MAKKNKVSPKRNELAKKLVKEFDIRTAAEAQDLLKEIFAPMLQSMLEGELDDKLGYDRYERTEEAKPKRCIRHRRESDLHVCQGDDDKGYLRTSI